MQGRPLRLECSIAEVREVGEWDVVSVSGGVAYSRRAVGCSPDIAEVKSRKLF